MLKAHFDGTFDVNKYRWNMKVSPKSYKKRRDKYFFDKLSDKYNLKELTMLFTFNFLSNKEAWVGDISDSDAIMFFRKREGDLSNTEQLFKEDIENLLYYCDKYEKKLKDLFQWDKSHPIIFKMLQQDIISYETFVIMDTIGRFSHKWDDKDLIWHEYKKRVEAYKKLLSINKNACRELFKTTVQTAI